MKHFEIHLHCYFYKNNNKKSQHLIQHLCSDRFYSILSILVANVM